jgi:hypothetical protein
MKTLHLEKRAWLAAGLRIAYLGLFVLLLLYFLASVQSAWPSGGPPISLPGASEVRPGNLSSPDLRSAALDRDDPGRHLVCPAVARPPDSGIYRNVNVRPAILGWLPQRCPLPPASAFHLQTNLRKYLETWPTPGSTTTEAWPEYVPEDGEGVD